MITEYVLFDLPPGITREQVVQGMREVAPRWRTEPELVRKTFVHDPVANQAGAFYVWTSRAAAERAHDAAWRQRIRDAYGSDPVVRVFDTPLVVDNALGRVIEPGADGAPLFAARGLHARELTAADVPAMQSFYEANPEYLLAINGRGPAADEARREYDDLPPAHLPHGRRWRLGLFDAAGTLQGLAFVLSDFVAAGVWHIGLYIVATRLHGSGVAGALYAALEAWMRDAGARWLRLGVVVGNARAEAFWRRQGYVEVRQRHGVDTGGRINSLRVLVKPLVDAPLSEYLAQVARDRPDSELA